MRTDDPRDSPRPPCHSPQSVFNAASLAQAASGTQLVINFFYSPATFDPLDTDIRRNPRPKHREPPIDNCVYPITMKSVQSQT